MQYVAAAQVHKWPAINYTATRSKLTRVFRRCSTSVESSTHWDPLYLKHLTIQVASEDISVRVDMLIVDIFGTPGYFICHFNS